MAHAKSMENLSIEKNQPNNAIRVLPETNKQEVFAGKASRVIFLWLIEGHVNILGAGFATTSQTRQRVS